MRFLIQTIEEQVRHDFSFTLLESVRYHKWLDANNDWDIVFTDGATIGGYVPIGSVEFVSKYLGDYYGLVVTPRNIPEELLGKRWTGREVINGTEEDIHGLRFVKSRDKIKGFTEICDVAPKGNYQISDIIDIQSEWRAFVYDRRLVGLQHYSGDFCLFPNVGKIRDMIVAFESQPIAYTLDVGIVESETVVIEVHDFFSCGLYGFSDHKLLPYMFNRWFHEYTKKAIIEDTGGVCSGFTYCVQCGGCK